MPALRTNTKKFEVLKFIGTHPGVKNQDVKEFIVTQIQKKQWDPAVGNRTWNTNLYGHRGIYRNYCHKVEGRWYLNPTTVDIVRQYYVTKGYTNPAVYGYGGGVPLADQNFQTDKISADGGGVLSMPQLPEPRIIREVEYIPVPPKKTMEEFFDGELDKLSIEELELEAIKVLRETRAALKAKTEEFHRVSRELRDAKNAETEAASVLRQALGL